MFPYLYAQHTDGDPLLYGTYGLMLVLAFLFAALISGRRMGQVGINPDAVVLLLVVAIVSSILGARLLHFLGSPVDRVRFLESPAVLFDLSSGGMAVMGGVAVAIISCVIYLKIRGFNAWKVADLAAPTILLGQAIGRMGCFFAGCCHGRVVKDVQVVSTWLSLPGGEIVGLKGAPWVGYIYHHASGPQDFGFLPEIQQGMGSTFDVALYPVQTYESLGALLGFILLSLVWKHWRFFDGQIIGLYLIAYAGLRYMVEFFRGDEVRGTGYEVLGLTLSTSQVTSLVFVAAGVGVMLVGFAVNRGVAPETPVADEDEGILDEADDLLV